jgi:hypothetical protein
MRKIAGLSRRQLIQGSAAAGVGIASLALPSSAQAASGPFASVANTTNWSALYTANGDAVTTATGAAEGITVRAFARDTGVIAYPAVTSANHSSNSQGQGIVADETYLYYGWSQTTDPSGFYIGRIRLDGSGTNEPTWVKLSTVGADWFSIADLTLAAGFLYATSRDGTSIIRVATDGATQDIWQNWWLNDFGAGPGLGQRLTRLASTGSHVFATDGTAGTTTSAIRVFRIAHSAPVSGTGVAKPHFEVVASSLPANPRTIAVDDTYLYISYGTGNDGWISRCWHNGNFFITQWARATLDGTTALSVNRMVVDDTSLYLQAGSGSTSQLVTLNLATKGVSQLVAPTGTGNLQPFRQGLALGPVSPV